MTCKGCLETVIVTEEVIQQLVKEAEEVTLMVVTDEIYEARLTKCECCPSLQYGTKCVHSGCIVRYRAKFKKILIYHARNYRDIIGNPLWDPNRHTRAQIINWNDIGTPNSGFLFPIL